MLNFKIALRSLFRWRRRSFLTGLSMAIGYVLASLSLSLSEGSYSGIIDLFTRDHTGHIQIHFGDYLDRPALNKQIRGVDQILETIEAQAGVVSASPRILAPSLAYSGDKSAVVQVIGIDPDREKQTTLLGDKVAEGAFISGAQTPDGYDQAMVGRGIAKSLKLGLGDELVLIGQAADGSIANDIYVVTGIVGTKDSHEKQNVYMTRNAAQRYLYMGSNVHEIAITLGHYSDAEPTAEALRQSLANSSLSIAPWQVVEKTFYESMRADKMGNYVSVGLIMLMVSIGVLNTVLMSTLERTREFGLLKAIGTRPKQVFKMIILEVSVLAALGCAFGAVIAWPINAYFSKQGIKLPEPMEVGGIPFDTILGEVSLVTMIVPGVLVLLTAVFVSVFPGIKAARVTPVRALGSV